MLSYAALSLHISFYSCDLQMQVECHPYFTQPKLLKYCRQHDIIIVGYSPLGTSRDESWYVAELLGDQQTCFVP